MKTEKNQPIYLYYINKQSKIKRECNTAEKCHDGEYNYVTRCNCATIIKMWYIQSPITTVETKLIYHLDIFKYDSEVKHSVCLGVDFFGGIITCCVWNIPMIEENM